ncbi:PorT family protein [Prevotella copri]|uniref:PorT family protein n=1 Tax=Segatella copri TaxID=165179 RepID=A0AAW5IQQ6_9BACT|nr:outer membrane beta-barrel protein [Segatella copri]MCP9535284.1 PorT family protein [Segatella copri]MCP9536523.1 PorT family protein [Segatella copri]MCP9541140.1 PorT family protein [Segatella copri]MCP9557815.1 PorT family protein [Segatella copri]MCP9562287.1 PorT family protein [Segatella copri]
MSNQDWTSKLQDQLAGYQESVSHDLWAGIEQSLAQNHIESVSSNPQTIASESSESADSNVGSEAKKDARVLHDSSEAKKDARIVYFKRWSAAAAAVALLGIGGSYVYLHQEDVEKGNLQLASLSSPAVSADLQSAASSVAASQSAPSLVVSADLQSAASQKKMGNVLEKESENEISLLAENPEPAEPVSEDKATDKSSDYKALTRSTDHHAAAYASQSYHFEKNEEVSGWSMQLYAENLTPSLGGVNSDASGGYNDFSYGTMAEPMPGVIPDPTAGGIYGEEYLLASYKAIQRSQQGNAKHHAPVSVGLQVAFGIAPRLSLSTGLVYTRTSSDFYPYAPGSSYNVHQVLHYVGIPVGLNYEFWQSGGFHAYVMAGAEADYNVKNDTEEEGVKKEDAKRDRVQLSGKASLGVQYDITPKVGLYIEPGAKYYFDNGSHVENTFKDKKLNFNLQFGLRFNL